MMLLQLFGLFGMIILVLIRLLRAAFSYIRSLISLDIKTSSEGLSQPVFNTPRLIKGLLDSLVIVFV